MTKNITSYINIYGPEKRIYFSGFLSDLRKIINYIHIDF